MSKSGTHFHFKRFSVRHDACTMKVGTDGVLLGAWVNVGGKNRILDVGTGSGVIALMLAQRTDPHVLIDAIEIAEADASQAKENVSLSPWKERIVIHQMALQQFDNDVTYDCIVSNPPYFNNSQQSPAQRRTTARHTTSLAYDDLLKHAHRLLSQQGTFNVILPYTEGLQFIALASTFSLYLTRRFSFRTRLEKPVERLLLEFRRTASAVDEGEVLLYEQALQWSPSYIALLKDFYLNI